MTTSPERPLALPAPLRALQHLRFSHQLGLCDRLYGRTLAAQGVVWVQTAPGPVWKLDLTDPTHRWIVYGFYEGPSLWRWFQRHATDARTIVDSGANIGQTALYFASLAPQARILAYEPGADARAWLAESVTAGGFNRISVESSALGPAPGEARLAARNPIRHGSSNQITTTEGEPVTIATLDQELDRLGVETVDLWKLDMEGFELPALQGATRALAAGRIRALYVELGEQGPAIVALLAAHGLQAHAIRNDGSLSPWRYEPNQACALFVPVHTAPARP